MSHLAAQAHLTMSLAWIIAKLLLLLLFQDTPCCLEAVKIINGLRNTVSLSNEGAQEYNVTDEIFIATLLSVPCLLQHPPLTPIMAYTFPELTWWRRWDIPEITIPPARERTVFFPLLKNIKNFQRKLSRSTEEKTKKKISYIVLHYPILHLFSFLIPTLRFCLNSIEERKC